MPNYSPVVIREKDFVRSYLRSIGKLSEFKKINMSTEAIAVGCYSFKARHPGYQISTYDVQVDLDYQEVQQQIAFEAKSPTTKKKNLIDQLSDLTKTIRTESEVRDLLSKILNSIAYNPSNKYKDSRMAIATLANKILTGA